MLIITQNFKWQNNLFNFDYDDDNDDDDDDDVNDDNDDDGPIFLIDYNDHEI